MFLSIHFFRDEMSEYTIDVVKSDIAALGKNVIKIRKYIRDHQSQLQQFSTNMLNQAVKSAIPPGMILKRNYGVLSLRAAGALAVEKAEKPKKKQVVEEVPEDEDESDDDYVDARQAVRRSSRRPPTVVDDYEPEPDYQYASREMPHYMMSNEDLAKTCFLEAAQRKWRRFA